MAITSKGLKLYLGSLLPHLIELDPRSIQPSLVMYHLKKGIINVGKSTPDRITDIGEWLYALNTVQIRIGVGGGGDYWC